MKITGGKLKGRNIFISEAFRPVQNITRQALFDLIGHDLSGITFLDLFAASGAVGLEALSRGAERVIFLERDAENFRLLNENLEKLRVFDFPQDYGNIELINEDAFKTVKHFAAEGRTFDVLFADPPYGRQMAKKTLKTLEAYDILHANSIVVIKHGKDEILPGKLGRFSHFRQKKYGNSLLTLYYN